MLPFTEMKAFTFRVCKYLLTQSVHSKRHKETDSLYCSLISSFWSGLLTDICTTKVQQELELVLCEMQWLSGRVLELRPRGRGLEPHWRHCVVVLEQDTFILAKYWFNPGRPFPV